SDSSVQQNVIAGSGCYGLVVYGDPSTDPVQGDVLDIDGNLIGVDKNGANALANACTGMYLSSVSNSMITGNQVSGNSMYGIYQGGLNAGGSLFENNLVGVNASGTAAVPNALTNLWIDGSPGNTIGNAGRGNTLAGSTAPDADNVYISGVSAHDNVVR